MHPSERPLWPPQTNSIIRVGQSINDGFRRTVLTLPTGGGKSRVACELIRDWLVCGMPTVLYTNRKMLIEQLSSTLFNFGFDFGVRAAGMVKHGKLPTDHPLQISSLPTEHSRTLTQKAWQLHQAKRVVIDEAHLNKGAVAQEIIKRHVEAGAVVLGMTATPIGLGDIYEHLVVGGTNSELRECGALVMATHKGCIEPDARHMRKATIDLTTQDVVKMMDVFRFSGHIFNAFDRYNPDRKPTICFAPDVPSSVWLCEEFNKRGVTAAHIDGKNLIYKGEAYPASGRTGREVRNEILRASRTGEVCVICNRFVAREGIDAPWLEVLIAATIFQSIGSYIQSLGRVLRAWPGKTWATILDFGGHWWRPGFGSANINRVWSLDDTEDRIYGLAEERARSDGKREPRRCPRCEGILLTDKCKCGYVVSVRSRPVLMANGKVGDLTGQILSPRHVRREPDTADKWKQVYYAMKNAGRTFRQARGYFHHKYGYFPPEGLPLMPKKLPDWFAPIKNIDREFLH